jgi:hypothetical protein
MSSHAYMSPGELANLLVHVDPVVANEAVSRLREHSLSGFIVAFKRVGGPSHPAEVRRLAKLAGSLFANQEMFESGEQSYTRFVNLTIPNYLLTEIEQGP